MMPLARRTQLRLTRGGRWKRVPERLRRLSFHLPLYTYNGSQDGRYYYVTGPLIPFPRFAVIAEALENEPEQWQKGGILPSGHAHGGHAVLYFSFWKLKLPVARRATFAEVDWYHGFQVVADRR